MKEIKDKYSAQGGYPVIPKELRLEELTKDVPKRNGFSSVRHKVKNKCRDLMNYFNNK